MQITLQELKSLVQEPYLTRGKEYFKDRLLDLVSIKQHRVEARVAGSSIYHVSIIKGSVKIVGTCDCIAFMDYGPCKHIAATGFAIIEQGKSRYYKPSEEYFDRVQSLDTIERYLSQQTKGRLISILLRLANNDQEVMEMLEELIDDEEI